MPTNRTCVVFSKPSFNANLTECVLTITVETHHVSSDFNFSHAYHTLIINKRLISCELFKGLLPARIQQFDQFQADKSFVGDKCAICIGEFEIGRKVMRLDRDGKHTFCQVCIEGWFAEHKTCPICRHFFG